MSHHWSQHSDLNFSRNGSRINHCELLVYKQIRNHGSDQWIIAAVLNNWKWRSSCLTVSVRVKSTVLRLVHTTTCDHPTVSNHSNWLLTTTSCNNLLLVEQWNYKATQSSSRVTLVLKMWTQILMNLPAQWIFTNRTSLHLMWEEESSKENLKSLLVWLTVVLELVTWVMLRVWDVQYVMWILIINDHHTHPLISTSNIYTQLLLFKHLHSKVMFLVKS